MTDALAYAALIRTCNSSRTLPDTIAALDRQTLRPSRYVIVDSGSTDDTLRYVPENATVVDYSEERFNYSEAINRGIGEADAPFTLVVSSHTSLTNLDAIEYAVKGLVAKPDIGACYFDLDPADGLATRIIDRSNFDGYNGTWNTCALYRTALLRERAFRREVVASEDQEWSRWLIEERGLAILRISGAGLAYANPQAPRFRKRLREHVGVAMYANRSLLSWRHIARTAAGAAQSKRLPRERAFALALAGSSAWARMFGVPPWLRL